MTGNSPGTSSDKAVKVPWVKVYPGINLDSGFVGYCLNTVAPFCQVIEGYFPVPDGDNRLLVAAIFSLSYRSFGTTPNMGPPTYGGIVGTPIPEASATYNMTQALRVWYWNEEQIASAADTTLKLDGAGSDLRHPGGLWAVAYSGVDQTAPIRDAQHRNNVVVVDGRPTMPNTLITQKNDIVLGLLRTEGNTHTSDIPFINNWEPSYVEMVAILHEEMIPPSTTHTYSWASAAELVAEGNSTDISWTKFISGANAAASAITLAMIAPEIEEIELASVSPGASLDTAWMTPIRSLAGVSSGSSLDTADILLMRSLAGVSSGSSADTASIASGRRSVYGVSAGSSLDKAGAEKNLHLPLFGVSPDGSLDTAGLAFRPAISGIGVGGSLDVAVPMANYAAPSDLVATAISWQSIRLNWRNHG
jgi:hypothetical protein